MQYVTFKFNKFTPGMGDGHSMTMAMDAVEIESLRWQDSHDTKNIVAHSSASKTTNIIPRDRVWLWVVQS